MAKLHLTPQMMKDWDAALQIEEDVCKQARMSIYTAEIGKRDRERDNLLSNLFGVVKAQTHSHIEQIHDAALKIHTALRPFYGTQERANDIKTGTIVALFVDMEDCAAELNVLGLTPVIERLKTVNEAYEQLINLRRKEDVKEQLPPAPTVRAEVNAHFENICQHIQASYILADSDEDRSMIFRLIALIECSAAETQTSYNMSRGQKKAAIERKEGKQLLMLLLPAFEKEHEWQPGSLRPTRKTARRKGKVKLYELAIDGNKKNTIWVEIEDDRLVQVEAPKRRKRRRTR